MKNKKLIILLKILLTLLIVFLIIRKIGLSSILDILSHGDLWMLIPVFIVNVVYFLIGAVNQWVLFMPFQKLKLVDFSHEYFTSILIGALTPGQIGEATIAMLLKKYNVPPTQSIGILGIDKLSAFIVSLIISLIGILIYDFPSAFKQITSCVIALFFILLTLILSAPVRKYIRYILEKHRIETVIDTLDSLPFLMRYHKRILVYNFLLKLIRAIIITIRVYFALTMFGISPTLTDIFFLHTISRVASIIPITINNIGVLEIAMIYFFKKAKIDSAVIICSMIVTRFVSYSFFIAFMINALYIKKSRFRHAKLDISK
ncbi:MAG: lysylphosphatidylglycerol synthase transmembrane domain-containing protein [Candidatus Hydrogenedentota bacterium]